MGLKYQYNKENIRMLQVKEEHKTLTEPVLKIFDQKFLGTALLFSREIPIWISVQQRKRTHASGYAKGCKIHTVLVLKTFD